MAKKIYFFILTILLTSLASASLNLNKNSMTFTFESGSEQCQLITLSSADYTGEIQIRDVWAENFNETRNLNFYNYTAQDHSLDISYIDTIDEFNNSITLEVCISGQNPGDFKGLLIFTPATQTNVNIEYAVPLLVHSLGDVTVTPNSDSPNGGSSGGGSNQPKTIKNTIQNLFADSVPNEIKEESPGDSPEQISDSDEQKSSLLLIIGSIFLVGIILTAITLLIRRRN